MATDIEQKRFEGNHRASCLTGLAITKLKKGFKRTIGSFKAI
jgi:hypothetical protein